MNIQRIFYFIGLVCSCWLLPVNLASYAQMPNIKPTEIQAVYLFRFIQFIEWPATAKSQQNPVAHLCVLGDDPYGETLDKAMQKGENIIDVDINIHRIRRLQQVYSASCHMLFVSQSKVYTQQRIINELANQPILTISESEDFAEQGGMIQFVQKKSRVSFIVNRESLDKAGLKASSRLLTIATKLLPPFE